MNTPDLNKIGRGMKWSSRWIKLNYPEFWERLMLYPEELSFSERLWWYKNNLTNYPLCECGKKTKYINSVLGYRTFCSNKCNQNSISTKLKSIESKSKLNKEEILKKYRETNLKKYGVEHPSKSPSIKEKTKKTNLKKYGVENPFSSKSIQDKIKQTNLEKYGVEWAMCSPEINIKMHNTMQERYGVKHALQKYTNIIDIDENEISHLRPCPHPDCNKCEEKTYSIKDTICFSRAQNGIELCTKLKPEYDFSQSSIEKWVTNLLKQNGIEYLTHYRLENKELDAFIPKKNIAFESNGCYWHSDVKKDKLYHHNKYKLCKNNNIQLFMIWEDWYINKNELLESMILSKLGIYEGRIYARKCEIREISFEQANVFILQNHIQGICPGATTSVGLFFNDELVSVMTFGKGRFKSKQVELLRYCSKQKIQIVGGPSKLLNYYIKNYNPTKIISYSSNDISSGNVYEQLGFQFVSETKYSYWYIKKNKLIRYNRQKFMKNKLSSIFPEYFDNNKTEFEIMNNTGMFYRIFDSGQKKFEKILNK